MADMKKTFIPKIGILLILLILAASPLFAADNPLAWIPAESEFIASLNLRQIADSSLLQQILQEKGGERFNATLLILKGITGMDILKDLDRITIWGLVDNNDSVVLLFQGRINQDALITLLKANPKYLATQRAGLTMHEWFDQKEKRMKYGAFLSENSGIICNQPQALDAAVAAHADVTKSFIESPKGNLIPSDTDALAGWAMIIRPERPMSNGRFKETLQAESAFASLAFNQDSVALSINVKTSSQEAGAGWLEMAKGFVALCRLQAENPNARKLATLSKTTSTKDGKGAILEINLTNQDVLDLMKQRVAALGRTN